MWSLKLTSHAAQFDTFMKGTLYMISADVKQVLEALTVTTQQFTTISEPGYDPSTDNSASTLLLVLPA